MQRVGHLQVEGDILAWGRHMLFLEQVFAALRAACARPALRPPSAHQSSSPWSAATCGWTSTAGRIASTSRKRGRAFPCSACTPPAPMAGNIARLLNDPAITARFRVHRLRPAVAWQVFAARRLRDRGLPAHHRALCRHRDGGVRARSAWARPVAMGCSIGGRAVLHLALRHGGAFPRRHRLAVGDARRGRADTGMRDLGVRYRPDIHGQEAAAGTVACLIAPTSPSAEQVGDAVALHAGRPIGSSWATCTLLQRRRPQERRPCRPGRQGCRTYLLTGEYDLSATPELTAKRAG